MVSELPGEDFFRDIPSADGNVRRKRGRPSEINPERLRQDANDLNFALEENWGEVGWLLWQAKTISDVRYAFRSIVNPQCHLLEKFRRDRTRSTTGSELRAIRVKLLEAIRCHRERLAQLRFASDRYKRAARAETVEADPLKRARLQMILSVLATNHHEAEALENSARLQFETLKTELEEREADFAQSEILRFVQSNRRKFTPSNLAGAMAGLPLVTARISCQNCTKGGIVPVPGLAFNIFETIERVLKEPVQDLGALIVAMRRRVLERPYNDLPHIAVLCENWYFLESAIRSAVCDMDAPYGTLAYRVFAEYMATSTRHSAADAVLALAKRLTRESLTGF